MIEAPTYNIGLDVGGTKIAAGLVEFPSGRVVSRRREPTDAGKGGAHVMNTCVRLAASLLEAAAREGLQVDGIGLGIAEMADRQGRITSSETIDWRAEDPAARFAGMPPLIIDSDARAGALAEATLGKGRDYSSFVYVTVGTGISYALVLDGKPYAGARGNAIVFANSPQAFCFACGQSSPTTLEGFAAGPALLRRYRESGGTADGGEDVLAAAARGDRAADDVVTSAAQALAGGVGALVNALDPEAVIVGGGLGTAHGLYWDHFLSRVRHSIWAEGTRDLPITQSTLGPDAGLLGAAALPLTERLRPR